MRDFLDFIRDWTLPIISLLTALVLLACLIHFPSKLACEYEWKDSTLSSRYTFMAGCQVKTKDGWIPVERYRSVE